MKYIFIDSNQYRHLFSKNEGFSDDIKKLLDNLIDRDHVTLLLPQQVKDEVERNRFEDWFNGERRDNAKKVTKIESEIKKYKDSLAEHPAELKKIVARLTSEKKKLESDQDKLTSRYRSLNSKANQKLKQLFEKATLIEESEVIIQAARLRLEKNNPPNDNKLGDALIWESLLYHLQNSPAQSSIVFVARDTDAWGKNGFNPWLEKELKEKTGVSISFTKSLSEIDDLTQEEQKSIQKIEQEELKNIAISNFVNSSSFHNAGYNVRALLQYKHLLNEDDFSQVVIASINNLEIYHSFFTSSPLNELCLDENGSANSHLEKIPSHIWDRFVKMNNINCIRIADLPF